MACHQLLTCGGQPAEWFWCAVLCCGASGQKLPMSGKVFISMADKYKADAVGIAKQLTDLGYGVVSTRGTAATLMAAGKCGCGLTAVAIMLLQEPVGCGMSAQSNPHPVAAGSPPLSSRSATVSACTEATLRTRAR
jgi:hypothetical protein